MKKIALTFILLQCALLPAYSQHLEFDLTSFYGIWNKEGGGYFYGGGGMEIAYEQPIANFALQGSLAFRSIDWGNQLTLNIGYKQAYVSKEKWSLNGLTTAGIGFALFRPKPLFVWSLGYMPELTWPAHKKVNVMIGWGIRYTHSPAYKKYGKINQVLEFPFKLGGRFRLGKTN